MNIGIIGSGNMGAAMGRAWAAKGHVVLFSNNPIYRSETVGSYSLVLNAILNFDNLNAGRKVAEK